MRVARLKLANVRAIEAAELRFRPGFNLVVGVNGVGKTTVLDALAICLSDVVQRANAHRSRVVRFKAEDIRMGADALDVACDTENGKENELHVYTIHKPRESAAPRTRRASKPREQAHDTPETVGSGALAPYRQVAVWWLQRQLGGSAMGSGRNAEPARVMASAGDADGRLPRP